MSISKPASRLLWTGVVLLVVIGIAAVTRRTLVLLWPSLSGGKSNPAAVLDAGFARHMALTLIHILPGGLFFALAPLQFMPSIRQKHLQFHRWSGRVLVICGLIIGVTALVMSYTMNIGGPNETAATTLFAIVFLICLVKAYLYIRSKEVARPIVGIFFATRRLTPHEFFGIAFWLGFTSTFLAAEAWIDYTRHRKVLATKRVASESPLASSFRD
jgi:hypothetical protein